MSTSATSSISSMLNSRTRVSGMASGLDTEALVAKLMKLETAKVDKVKQQKQVLEWQKTAYRDITSSLTALKNKYFNVTSSTNLFSANAFNKTAVTVSDPTVVSVTGSSTAGAATHSVKVNNIAAVGAEVGGALDSSISSSSNVSDLLNLAPVNGTFNDPMVKIDNKDGSSVSFNLQVGETIGSFINRVNNDKKNTSYRLSYDATGNRIVATTKNTGADTASISGTFLYAAGLTTSDSQKLTFDTAKDASFEIDGIAYTSSTNTYTTDGLTYNFLKGGGVTSNVSSTRDVEGIMTNIKEFVTAYNAIIDTINTKTTEKKYRDYTPLTDDQKSSMKDTDVTLWEEKAKSGLLRSDSLLTGIGDKLKVAMYSKYTLEDGVTSMSLSEIGISTKAYTDMGKLTIDETKLRKALTEKPDKVSELFTRESGMYNADGNNTVRQANSGLLTKVSDILSDYVRTNRDSRGNKGLLLEKAGTTGDTTDTNNYISKMISEKEDLIATLADKLLEKEDYYYSKFTAMETAISNMNSQGSFLSSLSGSKS